MTTSTVTTPAHYIDGNAEQVRNAINFHKFELDTSTLSIEENDLLLSLPQVDSVCVIKTNPNKSGSAFAQMKEYGIIAGFMRGHGAWSGAFCWYLGDVSGALGRSVGARVADNGEWHIDPFWCKLAEKD
jgi:rhodanese-related sulfurtransferase